MCVPKRTGVEQARHDTAMRAINRGRRNHPRHHNLVLPALTVAGGAVCLAIVAVAMWGAATLSRPPAAGTAHTGTTHTIEVVP